MNYHRNTVIATYRAAHPDNLEIDEQTLERLDANLATIYDAEVRSQAAANGIPISIFSLSTLVFFADQSTAKLVATRVRHACRFFLSTQPQP